ncbi:MAG: hypothetical protein ACTS53_00010 [Candidatus Hodgkinia cicadicola]
MFCLMEELSPPIDQITLRGIIVVLHFALGNESILNKTFTTTFDFKNVLSLQVALLPNGLIPSRKMTKFSRKLQGKFASEVKKCRCLGLIPNWTEITI